MDSKPDLIRILDYQYFNEIYDMEGMDDFPKETWEDKFCEAVEDLQRSGVRTGGSEENNDKGGRGKNKKNIQKNT